MFHSSTYVNLKKYIFILILVVMSQTVHARLKYVTVEVNGVGATERSAINDALTQAVSQINGTQIASTTALKTSEISNGESVLSNEEFRQAIKKKTKGVIKEYQVLSKKPSSAGAGLIDVAVRVTVAKYNAGKQSKRLRIVVAPFSSSKTINKWKKVDEFKIEITKSISNYLTQTRKFAMLDRENLKAQENELSLISSGKTPVEDLARLGQKLSTDLIIVGNVSAIHYHKKKVKLKISGKELITYNQGARITFRVIDVASGIIKYSGEIDKITHSKNYSSNNSKIAKKSAEIIGKDILNAIYPIRLLSVTGKDVFIGQGGTTLNRGDVYNLVILGKKLKDHYTGESLGSIENKVGEVRIVSVQSKQAKGRILNASVNVSKLFGSKQFLLRPKKSTNKTKKNFTKKVKSAKKSVSKFEEKISSDW